MALDERKVDRFVDGERIGDAVNQGLTRCAVEETRRKMGLSGEIDALVRRRNVNQGTVKRGRRGARGARTVEMRIDFVDVLDSCPTKPGVHNRALRF